jgi:broad specificity phosphatase PhoE
LNLPADGVAHGGAIRLWLVRHGQAAAGWGEELDPPLSPQGRLDAEVAADLLAPGGARPVMTSPLLRTRQTAEILASRWQATPVVADEVTEVPSPGAGGDASGGSDRANRAADPRAADPRAADPRAADPRAEDPQAVLRHRARWLAGFLNGRWTDQPASLWAWRRRLVGFLATLAQPTVVVTHAVAINTVLAEAAGDDRVFAWPVAPGSVTVVEVRRAERRWSVEVVAIGATDATSLVW